MPGTNWAEIIELPELLPGLTADRGEGEPSPPYGSAVSALQQRTGIRSGIL